MNRDENVMDSSWWKIFSYTDETNKKYDHTKVSLSFITDDGDFIIPIWYTHTTIHDMHNLLVGTLNLQL